MGPLRGELVSRPVATGRHRGADGSVRAAAGHRHRERRQPDGNAESLVLEALEEAGRGNLGLRELAHGILPAALTSGGFQAGVDAVGARLDVRIHVDVQAERFSPELEASAYFIVAEALTNIISVADGLLHVEVRDDGIGGADRNGRGLVGIRDRATTLGGRVSIQSPAGGGTLVAATLPLSAGERFLAFELPTTPPTQIRAAVGDHPERTSSPSR